MSLGGDYSAAMNLAVKAVRYIQCLIAELPELSIILLFSQAYTKNIPFFVAAGNENWDASAFSPSSKPTAFTIGYSNGANQRSSSSNYGPVVDLFAPGSSKKCASISGLNNFTMKSGSSMATPLAAGVGAVLLSASTISTPQALETEMKLVSNVIFANLTIK